MKAILSGVLSIPIVVSAYVGLHYHYKLSDYAAVTVGTAFQVMSYLGIIVFMNDSK